jgi:hypothetical protein
MIDKVRHAQTVKWCEGLSDAVRAQEVAHFVCSLERQLRQSHMLSTSDVVNTAATLMAGHQDWSEERAVRVAMKLRRMCAAALEEEIASTTGEVPAVPESVPGTTSGER